MPSWTWLELAHGWFAFVFIVAINVAVFTRMREGSWNDDSDVAGRKVKIRALASIWPCVEVNVEAHVPRKELRARRKRAREAERALRKIVRVSHVETSGDMVRVVVRRCRSTFARTTSSATSYPTCSRSKPRRTTVKAAPRAHQSP